MSWLNFTVPGTTEKEMRVNSDTYAIEVKSGTEWISCYQAGYRVTPGLVASVDEAAGTCQVKEDVASASTVPRFYRLKIPLVGESGLMIDSVFLPSSLFPSGSIGSGSSLPALLHLPVPKDPDNDALHLIVEFSEQPGFSSLTATIDTRTKRDGVYFFVGGQVGQYNPFPAGGVGLEAYKGDVMIDLAAAGVACTLFRRCRWHDGTDYTDWKGV
ncbi:MAG: hypothetical protein HPZ91_07255 [Lentisphaeria bacterium]|nr:hypothetical protein [Lentisphaeria bacterium]